MITRSATARTRVEEEEAETGGSEDEGHDAPLTEKERRRRAAELYVVGTELGIDGVTYRSVLEHVGLPSDKNAQSAVRKAADTIRSSEPEDEIATKFFADWMNDFFAARLDEDAGVDRSAPDAPESAEHERDVKAKIGASLVLESYQGDYRMTYAEACEACGLDRDSAADVNILGVRVLAGEGEGRAERRCRG